MERVKRELTSWNETLQVNKLPKDPTAFSFWVASNLPLDDHMKIRLLTINCAVQRLRYQLNILQKVRNSSEKRPDIAFATYFVFFRYRT